MFRYNVTGMREDNNLGSSNRWTAKIECGKLVVEHTEHGKYYVDSFQGDSGLVAEDETNIWYSFDPDRGNFHIVPDITVKVDVKDSNKTINEFLRETFKCFAGEIQNLCLGNCMVVSWTGNRGSKGSKYSEGEKPHVCNHIWKAGQIGKYEYLLSFNRLWCETLDADKDADKKEYRIHNNFGQMQFMRYMIKNEHINFPNGKGMFKMMYPSSDENGEGRFDCTSGHLVFNAPCTFPKDDEDKDRSTNVAFTSL